MICNISPARQYGLHPDNATGNNVPLGISHIDAIYGVYGKLLAGMKHGGCIRFGSMCGVATDNHSRWLAKSQLWHKAVGKAAGLVGDDPPIQPFCHKSIQHRVNAIKQYGVHRKMLLVQIKKTQPQPLELRMIRVHAKSQPDQAAGTVTGHRTDRSKWLR